MGADLGSADVGVGLLAADVLFARLQRHAVRLSEKRFGVQSSGLVMQGP